LQLHHHKLLLTLACNCDSRLYRTGRAGQDGRPRELAIPCEMRHFFARGGAMPRAAHSAVTTRGAASDHVVTDPRGRSSAVVMRGLMTKAMSRARVADVVATATAAAAQGPAQVMYAVAAYADPASVRGGTGTSTCPALPDGVASHAARWSGGGSDARSATAASCASIQVLQQALGAAAGPAGVHVVAALTDVGALPAVVDPADSARRRPGGLGPARRAPSAPLEGVMRTAALELRGRGSRSSTFHINRRSVLRH